MNKQRIYLKWPNLRYMLQIQLKICLLQKRFSKGCFRGSDLETLLNQWGLFYGTERNDGLSYGTEYFLKIKFAAYHY